MPFLLDMNLTPRWVQFLSNANHKAAHWSSLGEATATDHLICEYARKNGYVLITNDLDFPQILAHSRDGKPSIILLRGEPLVPESRGAAVLLVIEGYSSDLEKGAIITLDWSDKIRVRSLPLR
jgi:predicted nuclease of predicted toxin-antitoxin system